MPGRFTVEKDDKLDILGEKSAFWVRNNREMDSSQLTVFAFKGWPKTSDKLQLTLFDPP
jgi:hypothetical protein